MKIFILEDNSTHILLYERVFKECSCTLHVAKTFNEALDLLNTNIFDLYILDVKLNGETKNGIDVLKLIPEKEKIIIVSGINVDFYLEQNLLDVDFFLKPLDVKNFKIHVINKLLNKNQKIDD
jgi:CheY-like chemotaxis protein